MRDNNYYIIICIIILYILDDVFFQTYMKNNLSGLEVTGSDNNTLTANGGHIENSKLMN